MVQQKTVWITGASSGLGLHTAMAFRDDGWQVIAGARSFGKDGVGIDGITCLPLDVTSEDSIRAFCESAAAVAAPDALVQCAGMLVLGSCEETDPEEFRRVIDTNYLGMVRVNREVLPLMRAHGGGKIVLFSSINGLMGIPFQSAYTASKHAIEGYAECLSMEVKPFGIQVMLVEPGDHRTKTLDRKRIPFRRRIASADQHLAVYVHRFLGARINSAILRKYYIRQG